jgi:ABC-2 type transport system permease protein
MNQLWMTSSFQLLKVVKRMIPTLFFKTLRDRWRGSFGWGIGLVAMTTVLVSVYPTIRSSASALSTFVANYPEALRQIFRISDYTSGAGYLSSELFSFMVPLMFVAIGISWGASTTAQEEENRTADLLLTLPISRSKILATKVAAAISVQIVLAAVLYIALAVSVGVVSLPIGASKIAAACLSCALIGIMFNSVATFLGAALGKKSASVGGAIALALAGFLFYTLAPLVSTFDRVKLINPFQWTLGSEPLTRGINFGKVGLILFVTLTIYAASTSVFRRRDIQS